MNKTLLGLTILLVCINSQAKGDLRETMLNKLKQSKPLSGEYVSKVVGKWKGTCVTGALKEPHYKYEGDYRYFEDLESAFERDGSLKQGLTLKDSGVIDWRGRRISTKAEQIELFINTQNDNKKGLVIDHIHDLNLLTEITRFTLFNKIASVSSLPPSDPFIEVSNNRTLAVYPVTIPEGGQNFDHSVDLRMLGDNLYTLSRLRGTYRSHKNYQKDILCKLQKQ